MLQQKHAETIKKIAIALNQTDPDTFDSLVAVDSVDSIWARTFD